MKRIIVFALALSLGSTSVAFAGDSLLLSATRLVREAARTAAPPKASASTMAGAAQEAPAVSGSGLSKRSKILILVAAAVGYTATAFAIDSKVKDVTPSTLGTREDR